MATKAPDFTLKDAGGKTLSLAQFRGKPVVINFYKSTCPVCVEEMPNLEKVYEKHEGEPVEIVGVAVGADDAKATKLFAKQAGLKFPVGIDADRNVRLDYKLRKVPTLVFVNPEGEVVNSYVGGTARLAQAADQMIDALLGKGPAPAYAEEGGG